MESSFEAPEVDLAADGTRTTAGLGVGVAPEYEGADKYEAVPLPYLSVIFENDMSIMIAGNRAKVNLLPSEHWRLGLAGEYIKERDDVDSNAVDALPDVDGSFMAGGYVGYEADRWLIDLEALTDVSSGNEGTIARLRAGYNLSTEGECKTSINAFTTWADEDYMDAYFTITPAGSAASGLSTFQADDGIKDVGVSLVSHWKASDEWSVFGVVGYKLLLDDASDSPVVDVEGDENQFFGGVILAYTF